MKDFNHYYSKYSNLTLEVALDILNELNVLDEKIIICGKCGNYSISILNYCDGIPDCVLVSSIKPIHFCGGPPGCFIHVVGSLLDFIVDKIMYNDALKRHIGTQVARG